MAFTCLLPSIVIAEPEIENNPVEQSVIPENLVIDSQPLDVNVVSVAQDAEVTAVSELEVTSPAPVKLALADHSETGVAKERGIIEVVSPLSVVDGESSQMPFALLLALLALIAVVPMSRRH